MDFYNMVIILVACLAIGVLFEYLRNKKTGQVGMFTAIVVGLSMIVGAALHSGYLHEKKRQDWEHPWDHDEEEEEETN